MANAIILQLKISVLNKISLHQWAIFRIQENSVVLRLKIWKYLSLVSKSLELLDS
jgi:hypothetical protein